MTVGWTADLKADADFNEQDNIIYWRTSASRERVLIAELAKARIREDNADTAKFRSEVVVSTRKARVAFLEDRIEEMLTERRSKWLG